MVMLEEISNDDTSPRFRSLHFPKLQVFVEMSCAALQSTVYGVACVAAVYFPFPGGDRTSERKSGRAKEHARGRAEKAGAPCLG